MIKLLIPYAITATTAFLLATLLFWTPYRNKVNQLHSLQDSLVAIQVEQGGLLRELAQLRTQDARLQVAYQTSRATFIQQQDSLREVVSRMSLAQQVKTIIKTVNKPVYVRDTVKLLSQEGIFNPTPLGSVGFSLKRDSVCYDSVLHSLLTRQLVLGADCRQALDACQLSEAAARTAHTDEREAMLSVSQLPFWRSKKKGILQYQTLHPLP